MDITTDCKFGDLTTLRVDHGRRVRNGIGCYWTCICSCGKKMSVRDKDLIDGKKKSCKIAGRPCVQPSKSSSILKIDDVLHNHRVVYKVFDDGSYLKSYWMIECIKCKFQSQKRGDTIVHGTFKRCECSVD